MGVEGVVEPVPDDDVSRKKGASERMQVSTLDERDSRRHVNEETGIDTTTSPPTVMGEGSGNGGSGGGRGGSRLSQYSEKAKKAIVTYGKFVGPGFMVCNHTLRGQSESNQRARFQLHTSIQEITLRTWLLVLLIASSFCSLS